MILDSSALVALLLREPGNLLLKSKLLGATTVKVGAPTLAETALVLSVKMGRDARALVARLVQEASIEVVPFTEAHYAAATAAWLRFGKGRHPAALNFGDCLAYAVASLAGQPLLCKGDDFAQTDLELA